VIRWSVAIVGLLLAAAPLPAQGPGEREVLAVVQRLLDGMRAADTATVRSVFHPDARLVTTGVRDGEVRVGIVALDSFIQAVGGATEVWDERIHEPEVRIEDNLAFVWAAYTFYAGGRLSHCGIDAFQLVRTVEGWRIISIADTRRIDACTAPERIGSPREETGS